MGTSWRHLGAILGQRGILRPSWARRVPGGGWVNVCQIFRAQFWAHFGAYLFVFFCYLLGSFFGVFFCYFGGRFWGRFGDHFRSRSAQEAAKMGPRRALVASKTQKAAFATTLKNLQFFKVFGVQRPKKAPKTHPKSSKTSKKGSKNGPQNHHLFDRFRVYFGGHFGSRTCSKIGPKLVPFLGSC